MLAPPKDDEPWSVPSGTGAIERADGFAKAGAASTVGMTLGPAKIHATCPGNEGVHRLVRGADLGSGTGVLQVDRRHETGDRRPVVDGDGPIRQVEHGPARGIHERERPVPTEVIAMGVTPSACKVGACLATSVQVAATVVPALRSRSLLHIQPAAAACCGSAHCLPANLVLANAGAR